MLFLPKRKSIPEQINAQARPVECVRSDHEADRTAGNILRPTIPQNLSATNATMTTETVLKPSGTPKIFAGTNATSTWAQTPRDSSVKSQAVRQRTSAKTTFGDTTGRYTRIPDRCSVLIPNQWLPRNSMMCRLQQIATCLCRSLLAQAPWLTTLCRSPHRRLTRFRPTCVSIHASCRPLPYPTLTASR